MRHINFLLSSLCLAVSGSACAATAYSGEFDYMQFQPSATYFSGHTDTEIAHLCKTGEHASNEDLTQCSHREFERVSAQLARKLKAVQSQIERNDKALKDNHAEPLAMPYFAKSDAAWVQYRDSQCYAETYMLGEASERYINFWQCMTSVTRTRIRELDTVLRN
ncbi:DUF1311 domain-containing protein [Trinickia terrae]|uniref:DUF1311 domain-containing protein n=1 Tax=Trinickia terrae TaxID=2571161 RepID=A0A4U1IC29_9BURK|nr:lysozyme inhibitor LprI family protein [Trinickia terrae]TKC91154.1 DUF1311 domain-containing protein [Trinickia terrae]